MVEGFKKRKKYVIDPRFQYRMVSSFLLSVLLAITLFTAGAFGYFWISSMAGENIFREFITIDRQIIETREVEIDGRIEVRQVSYTETESGLKRWEMIVPPLVLNNLVIIMVVSILGLRYSHRIAGPAYRITQDIKSVLDDDEDLQISLRRKDKLGEMALEINRLIREYRKLKNS